MLTRGAAIVVPLPRTGSEREVAELGVPALAIVEDLDAVAKHL